MQACSLTTRRNLTSGTGNTSYHHYVTLSPPPSVRPGHPDCQCMHSRTKPNFPCLSHRLEASVEMYSGASCSCSDGQNPTHHDCLETSDERQTTYHSNSSCGPTHHKAVILPPKTCVHTVDLCHTPQDRSIAKRFD